jgi:hypothetical protein
MRFPRRVRCRQAGNTGYERALRSINEQEDWLNSLESADPRGLCVLVSPDRKELPRINGASPKSGPSSRPSGPKPRNR